MFVRAFAITGYLPFFNSFCLFTSPPAEIEEILPNLVTEDNKGIKSLDYAALGTIAGVLACREICKLRDKIDKLDKIIENKL